MHPTHGHDHIVSRHVMQRGDGLPQIQAPGRRAVGKRQIRECAQVAADEIAKPQIRSHALRQDRNQRS